jgi:peptidoglycan/LPS O-acetylase OafA/YrhL
VLINHFPLFYAGIIFFKIRSEGGNMFRYLTLSFSFAAALMLFNNGGRSMYYISTGDYLIVLLIYFVVFVLAISDRLRFLSTTPLLFMGRISYSFYLIHQFISSQVIIPWVQKYIGLSFYVAVAIAFGVCVCLATLTTLHIEEPGVRYGKIFLQRKL